MKKDLIKNIIIVLIAVVAVFFLVHKPTDTNDTGVAHSDKPYSYTVPEGYVLDEQSGVYLKKDDGYTISITTGTADIPQDGSEFTYDVGMVNGVAVYNNGVFTDVSSKYNTGISPESIIKQSTDGTFYSYSSYEQTARIYHLKDGEWLRIEFFIQSNDDNSTEEQYKKAYADYQSDAQKLFDSVKIN